VSDTRWQTLWTVFHEAAALPAERRPAYLDAACGEYPELRAEVEELLAQQASIGPLDGAPQLAELAAEALDPERLIGARLGAYRIDELIGEGGMGTVYVAEQQEPVRRRVALKVIKPGMDTQELVARFESERQALALMSHPGIAAVFDCGATAEGRPFFAMELVEGVPVTEFCDARELPLRRRLQLFARICDAVQHAHRKGIIHRDLKPSNVLVAGANGDATPKIIDFGIAKAMHESLTDSTLHTGLGRALGTPEYMSPEQAMGDPDVDTQSDVYSLGVMLCELLCGALPFDFNGRSAAAIRAVGRDDPLPPSRRFSSLGDRRAAIAAARSRDPARLQRELRGGLDWIVAKALQKDRSLRYGTAAELAADLRRYLDDEPVTAGPPTAAYRIRTFARRHRAAVLGTAAVFLTLVVGVIATSWMALAAAAGREAAREAQADAEVARDEARYEADTTQAINNLLLEVLGSPDPESGTFSPGEAREVKVVDVLERAAAESSDTFADRPRLEAMVRGVVGSTFLRLGLADEAEAQLLESLALYRRELGDDDPATLAARHNLAAAWSGQGRRPEAIEAYRVTLEARRRVLGDAHTDTLATMTDLANALVQQDEIAAAEELFGEVLGRGRSESAPDDPSVLQALSGLAFIRNRAGDATGAAELYAEVLERRRAQFGDDHPGTLTAINNLAAAYQRAGQLGYSTELYVEAVERMERVLGPDHASTLNAMSNLASLWRLQDRMADAGELFRRVTDANTATLGADHPQTLISANNLARTLTDLGEPAAAQVLYDDLMPRAKRVYPGGHPNLALFRGGHGLLLTQTGRYAEAEAELFAAFRALEAAVGIGHALTVSQIQRLVALYEAWEKPEKAAEYRALLPAR
jgi:serine/threonine protein kinase